MTLSPLETRIAEILAGPSGPDIGAFFDFDGTLIDGFSAKAWISERFRRRQIGLREAAELVGWARLKEPGDDDFLRLITNNIGRWAGLAETALAEQWQKLFAKKIAATMFPEAWALVQAHRRMGHTIAIASSATRWQIEPAAREFGIEHILATPVEVEDGRLTGRLAGAPLWNRGKSDAVRAFARRQGLKLGKSYGYANGDEDLAFLSVLGRPMAVNPYPKLAAAAQREGWPTASFALRRKTPLEYKARTVASYAAMATTFLGGLMAHKAGAPQRRALNFVTGLAPEIGLALAGIELRVTGEENLWKARPGVYVFNHQSPLDLVIGICLMRRDATGVVKKEVEDMLGWGHFMKFMDAAFVDRGDPEKAKAALAPAVEKLRAGMSLGICPEGTRSYSPRLGSFKKGAFHMAMQAGVPIVPVVLRNAGDVMHRDAAWMRPGVVDVCVLPPVPTGDWTRETLDHHIEAVRQQFIDTLADWPDGALTKAGKTVRRRLGAAA